jgi:hypothetical protein
MSKNDPLQIYEAFGFCRHFIIFGNPVTPNHFTIVKDTQTGKVHHYNGMGCFDNYRVLKSIPKWVKEEIVKIINYPPDPNRFDK